MKRFKKLFTMAFAIVFAVSGMAYADDGIMCAQVITYGLNPETGEWMTFPTPCDVPEGWESSMTRPEDIEPVIAPYIEPVIAPYNPDIEPVIAPYNPNTFTDADNGKSLTLKQGDTMRIVLESNPTTGFVWNVKTLDKDVLESTDTVYESDCTEAMMGCGGKEIWTFTAVAPGNTDLEMIYARPWETADQGARTFSLKVEVSTADLPEAVAIPLSCDADCNGDGVLNHDDLKKKRNQLDKEFKDWKNKCWKAKKDCGDYNGDGVTDQKDFLERKAYKYKAFKDWKYQCWKPALRIIEARTNDIGDKNKVSECGGFCLETAALTSDMKDENCRDEKLIWRYNEKNQTVIFLNENVWLNCCGERSVAILLNEETGTYELQETDMPDASEGGSLRCRCMCFYDFQVKLRNIETGIIKIKLFRIISDAGEPVSRIWNGELDLSKGKGEILISEKVGWCYDEPVCAEEEICGNGLDDDCDGDIDEDCGNPCGGIAGLACDEGEFCLFEENTCDWADNMGVCMPIPEICTFEYMPVCGCDGKTYGNKCEMMAAGQSKAYDGECR